MRALARFPTDESPEKGEHIGRLEAFGKKVGVSRELVRDGSRELANGHERVGGRELVFDGQYPFGRTRFLPPPLWEIYGPILGVCITHNMSSTAVVHHHHPCSPELIAPSANRRTSSLWLSPA